MQVLLRAVKGEWIGLTWLLSPGESIIGRAGGCHIRLMQKELSRRHCRLSVSREGILLSDLVSRNRTGLNGTWVLAELPLRNHDSISVCNTTFHVQILISDGIDLNDFDRVPYDEPAPSSVGPLACEDLLAAAGLTRDEFMRLIEEDRLRVV